MFDENFMYRLKYELNVQFQFIRLLGISFEKQIFFTKCILRKILF